MTWCWMPHVSSSRPASVAPAGDGLRRRAVGLAGRAVLHELDADHQPGSADVADRRDGPPSARAGRRSARRRARGRCRRGRSSRIVSSTATPAAHATGLPPYVVPCAPRPQRSPSSRRVTIADSGRPFAIAFATHTTSGTMPGVLERPHLAGPAVARLDLVGDEQDPVLVAQRRAARAGTRPARGSSRPRPGRAR